MSCPRCGCKETYHYDDEDAPADNYERCAACGVIFDIEDHADEEDEHQNDVQAAFGGSVQTPQQ